MIIDYVAWESNNWLKPEQWNKDLPNQLSDNRQKCLQYMMAPSASVRVQKYLHPHLQFWTQLIVQQTIAQKYFIIECAFVLLPAIVLFLFACCYNCRPTCAIIATVVDSIECVQCYFDDVLRYSRFCSFELIKSFVYSSHGMKGSLCI